MKKIFGLLLGLICWQNSQAATYYLSSPDTRVIGHNLLVHSRYEDTLVAIARRFDIGYREIVAANPDVDPWLPGDQSEILVPTQYILPNAPHKGIVINIAEMRLFYYPPTKRGETQRVVTLPIGIGRDGWETPLGVTKIIQKRKDPTWTPPESIRKEHAEKGDILPAVVPAGPNNPLGLFAMRLGIPGYLLHGTNRPAGVGMRVSHGCIRLFPEDIEYLFSQVSVNTPVRIVYQPYKIAMKGEQVYAEVHPEHEREGETKTPTQGITEALIAADLPGLSEQEWVAIDKMVKAQKGVAKALHDPAVKRIDDVWFLHAGLADKEKETLLPVLILEGLEERFWPVQNPAKGEILLGPFEDLAQAQDVAKTIFEKTEIIIWPTLVGEALL